MNKIDINIISPYIRFASLSLLPPHFSILDRVIYDYELIYVTGGKCMFTIAETKYILKKGDAVLIRPGIPHRFDAVQGEWFYQPHIHFDLVYSEKSEETPICFKLRSDMTEQETALIQDDILPSDIPCIFTPYSPERFSELFFDIITKYREKPPGYEFTSKARLIELIGLILVQFTDTHPNADNPSLHPCAAVKSYIDNNFHQIITLESLQSQFYVNKFTLMRHFKQLYGCNVISYYRSKRIEYAKMRLAVKGRSVASIGEELNFSDVYSFSRFFRTFTGMSPREYRDSLILNP